MTLRSLARASALYTVGNFIPRVGAFLLLPVYVRFLSRDEFGAVALVTSLAGLLAVAYRLGLDGALMRLHFDEQDDRQRALYSTLSAVAVFVAVAGSAVIGLVLGPQFSRLFSGLPFYPFGVLGLSIAAASAVSFAPAIFYRATGRATMFLVYSVGAFGASSLASVVLVVLGLGAPGMLVGQLVGGIVAVLVTAVLVVRIGGMRFDRSLIGPALRFGAPLTPHALSAWGLRMADRWLIGLLIGLPAVQALAELGAYALGYQLGYVITVIVTSFNAAWSPWFYRIGDRPEAAVVFSRMTTLVMGGVMVMGVGTSALAPQIVAIIARPEYASAADVLPVVAMASVLYGLYTMLSVAVFYAKATARLATITVTAALLNIGVNVVLIPPLGILGAAWATFVAYAFFAAVTWWYARRVYPVHLEVSRLAALAGLAGVALVLASLTDLAESALVTATLRGFVALAYAGVACIVVLGSARSLLHAYRGAEASRRLMPGQ